MSKSGRYNYRRPEKGRNTPTRPERHITVRSVKRTPPDLQKLSRAVIAMALAEAEAEKVQQEEEAAKTAAVTESGDDIAEADHED